MKLSHWRILAVTLALVVFGLLMFVRFAKASPLAPHVQDAKEKRLEHMYRAWENVTETLKK